MSQALPSTRSPVNDRRMGWEKWWKITERACLVLSTAGALVGGAFAVLGYYVPRTPTAPAPPQSTHAALAHVASASPTVTVNAPPPWVVWVFLAAALLLLATGWAMMIVRLRTARAAPKITSPEPTSNWPPKPPSAEGFYEATGHPIRDEFWTPMHVVANEARAANQDTPHGRSLGALTIEQRNNAYAMEIYRVVPVFGIPGPGLLCEEIKAKPSDFIFHRNGMQMDTVDQNRRPFYRFTHIRTPDAQRALAAIREMASKFEG